MPGIDLFADLKSQDIDLSVLKSAQQMHKCAGCTGGCEGCPIGKLAELTAGDSELSKMLQEEAAKITDVLFLGKEKDVTNQSEAKSKDKNTGSKKVEESEPETKKNTLKEGLLNKLKSSDKISQEGKKVISEIEKTIKSSQSTTESGKLNSKPKQDLDPHQYIKHSHNETKINQPPQIETAQTEKKPPNAADVLARKPQVIRGLITSEQTSPHKSNLSSPESKNNIYIKNSQVVTHSLDNTNLKNLNKLENVISRAIKETQSSLNTEKISHHVDSNRELIKAYHAIKFVKEKTVSEEANLPRVKTEIRQEVEKIKTALKIPEIKRILKVPRQNDARLHSTREIRNNGFHKIVAAGSGNYGSKTPARNNPAKRKDKAVVARQESLRELKQIKGRSFKLEQQHPVKNISGKTSAIIKPAAPPKMTKKTEAARKQLQQGGGEIKTNNPYREFRKSGGQTGTIIRPKTNLAPKPETRLTRRTGKNLAHNVASRGRNKTFRPAAHSKYYFKRYDRIDRAKNAAKQAGTARQPVKMLAKTRTYLLQRAKPAKTIINSLPKIKATMKAIKNMPQLFRKAAKPLLPAVKKLFAKTFLPYKAKEMLHKIVKYSLPEKLKQRGKLNTIRILSKSLRENLNKKIKNITARDFVFQLFLLNLRKNRKISHIKTGFNESVVIQKNKKKKIADKGLEIFEEDNISTQDDNQQSYEDEQKIEMKEVLEQDAENEEIKEQFLMASNVSGPKKELDIVQIEIGDDSNKNSYFSHVSED